MNILRIYKNHISVISYDNTNDDYIIYMDNASSYKIKFSQQSLDANSNLTDDMKQFIIDHNKTSLIDAIISDNDINEFTVGIIDRNVDTNDFIGIITSYNYKQ